MARFYFDVRDGDDFTADEDGVELPDLVAAQTECSRAMGELARDYLPGSIARVMSIEVHDEARLKVLTSTLRFEVKPLSTAPA
jgi:hypothetical protein